jgi:hypothetical protein
MVKLPLGIQTIPVGATGARFVSATIATGAKSHKDMEQATARVDNLMQVILET